MSSTLDDEDLSLSISSTRANRVPTTRIPEPRREHRKSRQHADRVSDSVSRGAQRLGQYDIVRTLGEGSFGKVKLAINRSTGQKVALKIITRNKLVTRDMAGRIEREIQYLQLLRHPHIIKLYAALPPVIVLDSMR